MNKPANITLYNTGVFVGAYILRDGVDCNSSGACSNLKNIGGSAFGGSAKGAAFIEYFVEAGIPWAHLDIAGIGDSQSHLPYCSPKGASGLVIRTLVDYLKNV